MTSALTDFIRFNALKHHYGYFCSRLGQWEKWPWDQVALEIQELGTNQFDVYTGALSPEEITGQTADQLNSCGVGSRDTLVKWLGKNGYRTLVLSDGSRWVVRLGEDPLKYIHLHPARQQNLVERIKASHLKTAVGLYMDPDYAGTEKNEEATALINRVRTARLGLSPVRSASESRRILQTLTFLHKRIFL